MAWVLQRLGQVPWGQVWAAGNGAYAWASGWASRSYAAAAAMPTECKQASVHASMVCMGYPPDCHIAPGLG
eukprot:649484-Pyramimonas_sp.AAC.1